METFIAYFDILGFKEFINNNESKETIRLFNHLLRETQNALSSGKMKASDASTIVPDLRYQKVNCLHISDSIIFWTNTNSEDDFRDLVDVCYTFYGRSLQMFFPLRGCLTYGDIYFYPATIQNENDITFYNYSLIGKGLISSYLKAENIEYAGCIVDEKAIKKLSDRVIDDLIYEQKICMYKVPFKNGFEYQHVFKPIDGSHNEVSFRNSVNAIKSLFSYASKTDIDNMPESVKRKLNNTIDFISYFRESNFRESDT